MALKERVSVARSFFDALGVSKAWQTQGDHDRSDGNIAAASIEFIFNDMTAQAFPVLSPEKDMFFNTMVSASRSLADFSYVCGLATYSARSMMNGIYDKNSVFSFLMKKDTEQLNFDTEAQIVQRAFFTDSYSRMLIRFCKKLQDIRYIVLHVYTERDPCSFCRKILTMLSREMNSKQCSPDVFFKSTHSRINVPSAQFLVVVSSKKGYGDARKLQKCSSLSMDKSNSCLFMPIDNLSSSLFVLSSIKEECDLKGLSENSVRNFIQERLTDKASNEQIIEAANYFAEAIHPRRGGLIKQLIGDVNANISAKKELLEFWAAFRRAGGNGAGEELRKISKIPEDCEVLRTILLEILQAHSKKKLTFEEIKGIVQGNLTKRRKEWRSIIPSTVGDTSLDKLSEVLDRNDLNETQKKRFEDEINDANITDDSIDEIIRCCKAQQST